MPDVVTAVVRAALNTTTGTQDFTTTDFGGGTPKAALFFTTAVLSDGQADNCRFAIGAATGAFNEWVMAAWIADAVSTTDCQSFYQNDACVLIPLDATTIDMEANFDSFITDGVRIDITNAGIAGLLTVVLFGGADLQAHANLVNMTGGSADTEFDVTDPGFEPDVVFAAFSDNASPGIKQHAQLSWGGVNNDGGGAETQRAWAGHHQNAAGFQARAAGQIATDRGGLNATNTGAEFVGVDFDNFDSSGFSVFSRTAGTTGRDLVYLALEFGGLKHEVRDLDTPTSTGNASITGVGFKPQLVIQGMTTHEAMDTADQTGLSGSLGVSAFTPDAEFSAGFQNEDGQATSDTQSVSNDQAIVHPLESGADGIIADFVSMDSGGWTLNYTTVTGTAKKFWALSIEEVAVAAVRDPIMSFGVIPFPRA